MVRHPLIIPLTAGLIVLLSTLTILLRYGPTLDIISIWQNQSNGPLHFPSYHGGHKSSAPISDNSTGSNGTSSHLLGVGKADITGPVVEINFMGYADPSQLGTGLRQRLYSRAFIIASPSNPRDRFVYLVLDTQSGDTAIRDGILQALASHAGLGALYGNQNLAVTGTHSHSGPGAWLNYLLPQITSKGFHKPSWQAIVDGAVASIVQAHETLALGHLSVGMAQVHNANINRSPYAYLANPAAERDKYKDDVDKTMTLLRFTHNGDGDDDEEKDIGILTWFPVHGTSMLGNNTLVTGDNKGVAAYLVEKSTANPEFVAGFSQANVGDTSPNVEGAYCEYGEQVGQLCDFKTSLCGNKSQPCHGRGPYWGRDDAGTASTFEIGSRQAEAALKAFHDTTPGAWTPINRGRVRSTHQFVDFSSLTIPHPNTTDSNNITYVCTCPAALGYSFAAGTTDGPGAFDFKQAPDDPKSSRLWNTIGGLVATPNETQKACHGEDKIILLDVGESLKPYDWSPNIVDVQLLRVGQFVVIVSPGEATTMAGRRWRNAVHAGAIEALAAEQQDEAEFAEAAEPIVVLGGPANTYTHYITTREEYAIQRYEGASTLYGPWTLDAYINRTLAFLPSLFGSSSASGSDPSTVHGPQPPINTNNSLSFIRPVVVDSTPWFKSFGAIKTDVHTSYKAGDTVTATFVAANPRNNLRLGGTFAAVEMWGWRDGVQAWWRVRDDGDWSLVFEWERTSSALGTSEATVSWEMGWETGGWRESSPREMGVGGEKEKMTGDLLLPRREEVDLRGRYRLVYYGDAKALGGGITAFEGHSGEFTVE
ncbi:hypothetical protein LTR62_008429 [Meristemomyces frigidus]|uniref:Neutral ceramidase n=1 Tax=Meristemomyces frigidus TaxID=1508187 RepID=A0AAN7TAV2_9PEZI|nr:hypothetical protein LTR62_008429 [Meristemomyces frigidus]